MVATAVPGATRTHELFQTTATWTAGPAKTTPTLGTSEATYFLGSGSDTWGRTWSATDFTNANLRVRITNVSSSSDVRDFFLDWVPVQVTYTPQ